MAENSQASQKGGHGIARNTQVRLFLTLWLVYLVHWSPFVVRELYLTISLAERGTVRVDPYVDLHSDLFTIPGRGSFVGANPGVSFLAVAPYWVALPVINRVAPVEPLPPDVGQELGQGYDEERINRLKFFRRARELGILKRLAVGALITSGFLMAPLTALAAVALMRVLGRMGFSRGAALWMGVLFGLGTPMFLRAGTLSLNLLVALCTLFAFALLWRPEDRKEESKRPPVDDETTQRFVRLPEAPAQKAKLDDDVTLRRQAMPVAFEDQDTAEIRIPPAAKPSRDWEWLRHLAAGFLSGWALLTDYTGGITLGVLGLFVLWHQGRSKSFGSAVAKGVWFAAGAALPVGALLYYQWLCFGNPWLPVQFHMPKVTFAGYPSEYGFGWPLPEALFGLMFDPQYGLLVFAPVFALALYHPVLVWRRRNLVPGRVALLAWVLFAALYVFCSMIHYTIRHQWQDGVRYIVPALPLLFLLVADVLAGARRSVVLLITIAAVGESWLVAMVRANPYESLQRVLAEGIQYPWLTTLSHVTSADAPKLVEPGSWQAAALPWGVLAAMLIGVAVIWAFPGGRRHADGSA